MTICSQHSGFDERIKALEKQNRAQWNKIGEIERIAYKILGAAIVVPVLVGLVNLLVIISRVPKP